MRSLAVCQGSLYVGGYFTGVGPDIAANSIACWDGAAWSALGSGIGSGVFGDYQYVFALDVYGDDLIAAGRFWLAGGNDVGCIAAWDGAEWSPLGSGLDNPAHALAVHENDLYPGGDFHYAGGRSSVHMARWMGLSADVVLGAARSDPELRVPNPFRAGQAILLRAPGHHRAVVDIFDVSGRRIVTLAAKPGRRDWAQLAWDGHTAGGVRADPGVYYLRRVGASPGRGASPLILIR